MAILASKAPSVNPLVVVAIGATRAEQLIVREISEPEMTDAAIRIYNSLFGDQIDSASMTHRPSSYRRGFPTKIVLPARFSHFLHRIRRSRRRIL
ncbi:hypothetical protein [Sinorhizobium meliloti]|uniref:hypothetical protein n=1 Tax=Rhizobium meliloti TaxID=382 RepID=UPI0013E3D3B4|nr:hypothetical protein [Sinorhizobium meliloti]